MPEPITTAMVWGLSGAVVSGIIGNRADDFAVNNWQRFLENARQYRPGENHELQRTLYRAYLQATLQICAQRGEKLGMPVTRWVLGKIQKLSQGDVLGGFKDKAEQQWIYKVKDGICDRLKNLELPSDYENKELDNLQKEVELLMQVKEAAQREAQLRQPLIENTLKDLECAYGAVPEDFKGLFERSWFNYVCACFQYQLATNPHIADKFQNRLLSKITARSASTEVFEVTIAETQVELKRLGGEMSQQLHEIERLLNKSQRKLNEAERDIWLPILALDEDTNARIRRVEELLVSVTGVLEEADLSGMKEVLTQMLELARVASLKNQEPEIPGIPDDIQAIFDEGLELRNLCKYEEASKMFQKGLELATSREHRLAAAEAKRYQAVMLIERDKKPEATKALLEECLKEFTDIKATLSLAVTLSHLGWLEADSGNLDQAEAYLSQALELHKKNDNKLHIASTSQELGRIKSERGNYQEAIDFEDQALKIYLTLYRANSDSKRHKDLLLWIAGCYRNKGLAYRNLGGTEEEETNYERALEWQRKTGYQRRIGGLLLDLARLKFREGRYDQGIQLLDEATEISSKLEDGSFSAECLDLKGRLLNRLGDVDKAFSALESVLASEQKAGEHTKQAASLVELGQFCLENKEQPEQAKNFFERARDLSLRERLPDLYAQAVMGLSQIAHIEENNEERITLLKDGIQTLEKLLLTTQANPKRAEIVGLIGNLYVRMENFQQALVYFKKAKKAFEDISDINGLARCLRAIGQINGLLGKIGDEFNTYRELKNLVDGTPYYDLIGETAIRLAEINIQIGNLDEARMMIHEAEFLCQKYNLRYAGRLANNIKKLDNQIAIRKIPELSFEQLVNELFELIDWFPEEKNSIFRFWITYRISTIQANVRNMSGVKFMLCQDNVTDFLKISQGLRPYSDLCLQVVTANSNAPLQDSSPFPKDKQLPHDIGIPLFRAVFQPVGNHKLIQHYLQGSVDSTFQMTFSEVHSEITGNEGFVISFQPYPVPDQAHELVLSKSAEELIQERVFYFPYPRYSFNDKLFNDLVESKTLGLIPVYFDSLPNSGNVTILRSANINLPILSTDDVDGKRSQIRKVKRALTQLLSIPVDAAQTALSDLVFEVEELFDICQKGPLVQLQVYILQYPSASDKKIHVAVVAINDSPKLVV